MSASPATHPAPELDHAALERELIRDEGLRLAPYRCTAGKLTVGCGRNLDDVGVSERELAALGLSLAHIRRLGLSSREQALLLLRADIARVEDELDQHLPWWRALNGVRQRVLVNMAYNMGLGSAESGHGLLSFVRTLQHVRSGRWPQAAAGMRASKWARQVKARADRLAHMMETGHA